MTFQESNKYSSSTWKVYLYCKVFSPPSSYGPAKPRFIGRLVRRSSDISELRLKPDSCCDKYCHQAEKAVPGIFILRSRESPFKASRPIWLVYKCWLNTRSFLCGLCACFANFAWTYFTQSSQRKKTRKDYRRDIIQEASAFFLVPDILIALLLF